jgi:hypothetical protein
MCFNFNTAQFLSFEFWNARADIFLMIIAFLALVFAIIQILSSRNEARRSTAYASYQNYLNLCFQHPELARGSEVDITSNPTTYSKYRWFIAQMLFCFEQVLDAEPNSCTWNEAIKSQLERHTWHLEVSKSVARKEWSSRLRKHLPKSREHVMTEVT